MGILQKLQTEGYTWGISHETLQDKLFKRRQQINGKWVYIIPPFEPDEYTKEEFESLFNVTVN